MTTEDSPDTGGGFDKFPGRAGSETEIGKRDNDRGPQGFTAAERAPVGDFGSASARGRKTTGRLQTETNLATDLPLNRRGGGGFGFVEALSTVAGIVGTLVGGGAGLLAIPEEVGVGLRVASGINTARSLDRLNQRRNRTVRGLSTGIRTSTQDAIVRGGQGGLEKLPENRKLLLGK